MKDAAETLSVAVITQAHTRNCLASSRFHEESGKNEGPAPNSRLASLSALCSISKELVTEKDSSQHQWDGLLTPLQHQG